MIRSVHIENYKCFKEFDIDLGPFTVIIGPNDSGKTTFLECLRVAGAFRGPGTSPVEESLTGAPNVKNLFWQQQLDLEILIRIEGFDSNDVVQIKSQMQENRFRCECNEAAFARTVGSVGYYQMEPSLMKQPSKIASSTVRLGAGGANFPTFLEEMLLRDRDAFQAMERAFCQRFPSYTGIALERTSVEGQPGLCLLVKRGKKQALPIRLISDGAALSLGYLGLSHQPFPPQVLLVEEPENGLHHAKMKEIVETLRLLPDSRKVQVILSTHSPYLLDLVNPDEVQVFQKDEEGAVHSRKLSDFPDADDLKKNFMTGEIWTILAGTQKI